jgi:hypothetical protein
LPGAASRTLDFGPLDALPPASSHLLNSWCNGYELRPSLRSPRLSFHVPSPPPSPYLFYL